MKSIRKVLAAIKKADLKFNLINKSDKIAVGISGGKDSLVLFYALTLYQKFAKKDFTLVPILLNLGFAEVDFTNLKTWFNSLGYELIIEDSTQVGQILKIQKGDKEKLSCSICSRMKKAAINNVAHKYGCNKVAFAHHAEDAIETLWMNQIFGARMATFAPKMHLEKTDLIFIRPLILAREANIAGCAKELEVPVTSLKCPNDKHTMREEAKLWLTSLYKQFPEAKENMLTMLLNYEKEDLWKNKIAIPLNEENLYVRPVIDSFTYHDMVIIRQKVFIEELRNKFEDEFSSIDEKTYSYVLYLNNTAIGAIKYKDNGDRTFELTSFCIINEFRNKGYGSLLLQFIETELFNNFNPCKLLISTSFNKEFFIKRDYTIDEDNKLTKQL